jgi:hypothetical protein
MSPLTQVNAVQTSMKFVMIFHTYILPAYRCMILAKCNIFHFLKTVYQKHKIWLSYVVRPLLFPHDILMTISFSQLIWKQQEKEFYLYQQSTRSNPMEIEDSYRFFTSLQWITFQHSKTFPTFSWKYLWTTSIYL